MISDKEYLKGLETQLERLKEEYRKIRDRESDLLCAWDVVQHITIIKNKIKELKEKGNLE
ncbi:hypothetical protein I906_gp34 [Bacillus phage Curly]|uniref:Uncharacterized protein n=1 Tax=Bacillus phage Curly TaxID=2880541 RepID=M1IE60_9CAUD|nr:hypothetical protein I906_gp34 [Bacillus phage Curly]AGE60721.1 hypothetical protein CURLY_34 [Bacillus phage Curly]